MFCCGQVLGQEKNLSFFGDFPGRSADPLARCCVQAPGPRIAVPPLPPGPQSFAGQLAALHGASAVRYKKSSASVVGPIAPRAGAGW